MQYDLRLMLFKWRQCQHVHKNDDDDDYEEKDNTISHKDHKSDPIRGAQFLVT